MLVDYFFDGKGDIKLVEELMAGGELLEKISTKAYFSESEARKYFKAIAGEAGWRARCGRTCVLISLHQEQRAYTTGGIGPFLSKCIIAMD